MMRRPATAVIQAAELRVAQSRQSIGGSLRRARAAFAANLTRPSTLLLAAGAACLLVWRFARRPRAGTSSDGLGIATTTSVLGLVLALAMRYSMQSLPFIVRQVWAVRRKRTAQAGHEIAEPPVSGYAMAAADDSRSGRALRT